MLRMDATPPGAAAADGTKTQAGIAATATGPSPPAMQRVPVAAVPSAVPSQQQLVDTGLDEMD